MMLSSGGDQKKMVCHSALLAQILGSVYSQTIRETVVFDAITLIVGMELRTSYIRAL